MLLKMVLDCREHKLMEIFPETETQQLDIGDILYVDSENSDIKCIVERKTLNDLSSSIIDGRYKEQKSRLVASGYKIIYIIEGLTKNNHGVKFSTLLSAMLNIQIRDNITVIRTKDINETANILIMLKEKLPNTDTKQIVYNSSIHISKKQNMTKELVFINQLSCIPGISDKISRDICNVYPRMRDLILKYNELETERERERLLTSINGIGTVLSRKVYDFIY